MAKDPYAILGVSKGATDAEIKSAYRKLAKQHHPDLNPSNKEAAARFQEISAANDVLSDKEKRAAFDRGEIDMEGQPVHAQPSYRDYAQGPQGNRYYHFNADNSSADAPDLDDLFSSFFHGGRGSQGNFAEAPEDSHYAIEIDFLEAAKGGSKQITLPDGRALNMTIPEGVEDGQKLRLKGQGNKGPKGQAADAYMEVHIRPHPSFTRKGQDIYVEIPVGFHESILGRKIEVPTIHGMVEVAIPKGSGSGSTLRLKGKGIKHGDQYVKLKLMVPSKIDSELNDAIQQWANTHSYNPRKSPETAS